MVAVVASELGCLHACIMGVLRVCVCVCVCVNGQSGATSLHTFNVRMFEGTIEEEVRNEVEGMQRTRGRGGGEA